MKLGSRYEEGELRFSEESILEDRLNEVSQEKVTYNMVQKISNEQFKFLRFTGELLD